MNPIKGYDVVIVGGGVTGTALAYALSRFSNVKRIALLEKNPGLAQVNSHPLNNAQTSHDGGTETNYSLDHALEVQKAARVLRAYVRKRNAPGLFKKTHRMVLGVGAAEVKQLEKRFAEFRAHYPDLRLIYGEDLWRVERKVMEGREFGQPVAALISDQGIAVDYQKLSECLIEDAKAEDKVVDVFFNTSVEKILRGNGAYLLGNDESSFLAPVVVFAAGSYSLWFAHKLGYAKNLAILAVAGSFYSGGDLLNGKVYRVQIEGMPFAAIHGDPDVLNQKDTRFGPTTKPLPLMERHRYGTMPHFLSLGLASVSGVAKLLRMIHRRRLYWYVLKNVLYDLPFVGPRMFVREARVIVPTIKHTDLKLRRGVGGIRPQIFNLDTGDLEMGDSSIEGKSIIFNTTPSPGASICLANAARDAERVVKFLGGEHHFDRKRFESELS